MTTNLDRVVNVAIEALQQKASVRLATVAALPAYTPAGSGAGKTLTANANGALSLDGIPVVAGDRVLVKDEGGGTSVHNGIYVVTAPGSGGSPYVLTRATDFDGALGPGEVSDGSFTFVGHGTLAGTGWLLTTNNPIVVDTTPLSFAQFNRSVRPTTADKSLQSAATTGNYQTTGITISATPALGGHVQVNVNGIGVPVGDGHRDDLGDFTNNVGAYFSGDGGATARAQSAIVAGDTLYWNGTHIGYDLTTAYKIDLIYDILTT